MVAELGGGTRPSPLMVAERGGEAWWRSSPPPLMVAEPGCLLPACWLPVACLLPAIRVAACCLLFVLLPGACVPLLPFWSVIVFPGCRFALVAVLVVLGFLVTVFVGACVP